jgi:hypothetical protein
MVNLEQITTQVVQTIRREMFAETVSIAVLDGATQHCKSLLIGDGAVRAKRSRSRSP